MGMAPDLALLDRIPGEEIGAPCLAAIGLAEGLENAHVEAGIPAALLEFPVRIAAVDITHVADGQIDEACLGMEAHRGPAVGAVGARADETRFGLEVGIGRLDRASVRVVVCGPVDVGDRLGGDEFPRLTVDHEEEAVLRRLHQDLAEPAPDLEVGEHDVLRRGVVPGLGRGRLVVPDELARVGAQGEDRGEIEVVAAARAAQPAHVGRAVAGADIEQSELRVVGHAVPDRAAPAGLPPLAGPGLGGAFQGGGFEAFRGIAGDGVSPPGQLAGRGVVGRHIAARAEIGAGVADDDLAFHDARSTGDRIAERRLDGRGRPGLLARGTVDGDEPSVEGPDEDAIVPQRDPAVHEPAADLARMRTRNFGIEGPEALARRGVEGVEDAPGRTHVHHAVRHEGRRLDPVLALEIEAPGEAEILHVRFVDLAERAVALLGVVAAVGDPLVRIGGDDARLVDGARGRTRARRLRGRGRRGRRVGRLAGGEGAATGEREGDQADRCGGSGRVRRTIGRGRHEGRSFGGWLAGHDTKRREGWEWVVIIGLRSVITGERPGKSAVATEHAAARR